MAVSHYLKPGLTDKTRVKILTVHPASRRIEAMLKDGSMIHVAVWDTPHAFRWPIENEIWIVRRDGGIWMLDCKADGQITGTGTSVQLNPESHGVETMAPGDLKLDSTTIVDGNGHRLASSVQGSWTALSYGTGYTDFAGGFQTGQWLKDTLGFVHVRGLVKKTTAWVNGETLATLPAGARPATVENFFLMAADATTLGFAADVSIDASGAIILAYLFPIIGVPDLLTFLSLGGVTFQQVN